MWATAGASEQRDSASARDISPPRRASPSECGAPGTYITIKGEPNGIVRPEYEYPVPVDEAEAMLESLCRRPLIEKTRYHVMHEGMLWFVDEFCGDNAGLLLAEVELDDPAQPVRLPPWVGDEVTRDPRYRNSRPGGRAARLVPARRMLSEPVRPRCSLLFRSFARLSQNGGQSEDKLSAN